MMPELGQSMSEEDIRSCLERGLANSMRMVKQPRLIDAAVLIPFLKIENSWHLLFIRRTETVQSHKGQVAFPGGATEPEDADPEETALREAWEEIGLERDNVRVLGRLPSLETITSFWITPIVGRIVEPFELQLAPDEVSRAFTIPLSWLANPSRYEIRPFLRPGSAKDEPVVFYEPYEGELLWGITARITLTLIETLESYSLRAR